MKEQRWESSESTIQRRWRCEGLLGCPLITTSEPTVKGRKWIQLIGLGNKPFQLIRVELRWLDSPDNAPRCVRLKNLIRKYSLPLCFLMFARWVKLFDLWHAWEFISKGFINVTKLRQELKRITNSEFFGSAISNSAHFFSRFCCHWNDYDFPSITHDFPPPLCISAHLNSV